MSYLHLLHLLQYLTVYDIGRFDNSCLSHEYQHALIVVIYQIICVLYASIICIYHFIFIISIISISIISIISIPIISISYVLSASISSVYQIICVISTSILFLLYPSIYHIHLYIGHPMKPHRLRMTHQLILSYGLYRKMEVYRPKISTSQQLQQFHSEDYIEFLKKISPDNTKLYIPQMQKFNLGIITISISICVIALSGRIQL